MKRKLTTEEIEFIKKNYHEMGGKCISDQLSVNRSTVMSVAHRHGLKINDSLKTTRFKEKNIISISDYTRVIDPKIAYALGLIWTDGNVSLSNNKNKTPIIKHNCVKYDSFVSNKVFKEMSWRCFDSENLKSIGKNTMTTHWISSRPLGEYLISENFKDKNKGTFIYNNFLNIKNHFVRGIFDGDGCITMSSNKKYKQTAIYFSSTSDQEWKFIIDIFDEINVKYKIRKIVDKLGKSSQVCIHDSLSIYNLCEFMYKDSDGIRLERKYEKYKEFLEYKKVFKRNNKLSSILK